MEIADAVHILPESEIALNGTNLSLGHNSPLLGTVLDASVELDEVTVNNVELVRSQELLVRAPQRRPDAGATGFSRCIIANAVGILGAAG